MRRLIQIISGIVAVLVLVIITAAVAALIANLHARREAEALLDEVRTLRVGVSTKDDVMNIVQRYRPTEASIECTPSDSSQPYSPPDSTYAVLVTNLTLNRIGLAIPLLQRIGFRPWGVVSTFALRGGRLCSVEYRVSSARSPLQLDLSASAFGNCKPANSNQPCYDVQGGGVRNIRRLDIKIASDASDGERRRAFDFAFGCTTTLHGCEALCQLHHSAWVDEFEKLQKEGQPLPPELNDPRCLALERSSP